MKLSVLFVDDDTSIIEGLRRMMYPMRKEWDLIYANGGKSALEVLADTKIDVIISDIRMPGLDGTQLLTEVKDKYPNIVRITLSGYANDNTALKNTRIVHQSLSKPTTPESVKNTIEKAYQLRKKLHSEELLSIVNGIDELPSLPEIYLELEKEANSPNSSIDKLSGIMSKDPIMAAKILQLTNSAFFGLPNRISNITQALNFLGIKLIQNLVLSIKLFRSIDPDSQYANIYQEIWNHSNKVAMITHQIAKIKNLPKSTAEDAYLGGLFHDIGKLLIIENFDGIQISKNCDFSEYEKHFSNTTHADIGAYLLGIWGLPDPIVESVAYHHIEDTMFENNLTPTKLVYLANKISYDKDITVADISKDNIDDLIKKYGSLQMEGSK